MTGIVRLSTKELDELIESVEAEGGDPTEFKRLRAEFAEVQPRKLARRQATSVVSREEETTEERLNREAGDLFPKGISADILAICIEYDGNYSLKELKTMCVEAGLSPSGHKKLLAAKLIAHSLPLDKGKGGEASLKTKVPFSIIVHCFLSTTLSGGPIF